jgi:hypothetical protein
MTQLALRIRRVVTIQATQAIIRIKTAREIAPRPVPGSMILLRESQSESMIALHMKKNPCS